MLSDTDNQVPVLGTVAFISRDVSCDRKVHLIPKIRKPLVLANLDIAELSSSHSCTVFVS